MTPAQIVASYNDETLKGIVRDLMRNGQWQQRLRAALIELQRRKTRP